MEKGQKVWTLYMSNQFETGSGFSGWIDEYEVINSDVGENLMVLRGKYGSAVTRTPAEVYTTKQAAQEAMIAAIHTRVSAALKQIQKIESEIEAANQVEVTA